MSNQFLYKPNSERGTLAVLLPNSFGDGVQVQLVDASGNVVATGTFSGRHNGDRPTFYFPKAGGAYGSNISVKIIDGDGNFSFPIADAGQRYIATGTDTGSLRADPGGPGSKGQVGGGGGSGYIEVMPGVFIPEGVDFNAEDFYIDFGEAYQSAKDLGQDNVDTFLENFGMSQDLAEQIADRAIDLELKGLEEFVPRASKIIRAADAETNELILSESERFDVERQRRAGEATDFNVAKRQGIFGEDYAKITGPNERAIARAEGLATGVLPDELLNDQLSRTARNRAVDQSTAGGFGVSSAATRNFLDRTDLMTRLDLAQRGEQNLQSALGTQLSATNAYSSLIDKGITDFRPLEISPVIRDIGSEIQATPINEPGQVFRQEGQSIRGDLNAMTTVPFSSLLQGELSEQEFNRGLDMQQLAFEQEQNQALADALNVSADIDQANQNISDAERIFLDGMNEGNAAAFDMARAAFVAAGLGFLYDKFIADPAGRQILIDTAKKLGINLEGIFTPSNPSAGPGEPGYTGPPPGEDSGTGTSTQPQDPGSNQTEDGGTGDVIPGGDPGQQPGALDPSPIDDDGGGFFPDTTIIDPSLPPGGSTPQRTFIDEATGMKMSQNGEYEPKEVKSAQDVGVAVRQPDGSTYVYGANGITRVIRDEDFIKAMQGQTAPAEAIKDMQTADPLTREMRNMVVAKHSNLTDTQQAAVLKNSLWTFLTEYANGGIR